MSLEAVEPSVFFKDNQQLRWLLSAGPALRKIALSESDLERAKARLEVFDEVLIFEDFHARDRYRLAKFGWQALDDFPGSALHASEPRSLEARSVEQSVISRMRKVQSWDLALYQHATTLAKQQAETAGNRGSEALQVL